MAMFEPRRVDRRDPRIGLLVGAVVVALGWSAWTAATLPREDGVARSPEPLARISLSAALIEPRLVATRALTDFGVDAGARYVAVRILARVGLEVRIVSDADIVLARYPRLCLIGPFSMPDYAGLSEPCWGEPDLSQVLRRRLPTDRDGRPILRAGRPITLVTALSRNADRCDYPPGEWRLELDLEPGIAGGAAAVPDVAPVALHVAAGTADPLRLIKRTHYCGIANVVYREQGEPFLVAE